MRIDYIASGTCSKAHARRWDRPHQFQLGLNDHIQSSTDTQYPLLPSFAWWYWSIGHLPLSVGCLVLEPRTDLVNGLTIRPIPAPLARIASRTTISSKFYHSADH